MQEAAASTRGHCRLVQDDILTASLLVQYFMFNIKQINVNEKHFTLIAAFKSNKTRRTVNLLEKIYLKVTTKYYQYKKYKSTKSVAQK